MLTNAVARGTRPKRHLDGEIDQLVDDGAPQFYDLMRRRKPQHYYAFDLLWLDSRDPRDVALLDRKRLLRDLLRPNGRRCSLDHASREGVPAFGAACERDLEGVVATVEERAVYAYKRRPR